MGRWQRWSWSMISPVLFLVGCTVSVGNGSSDTVRVTVRAQYEKRTIGSGGMGALTTRPARYAYANLVNTSTNNVIDSVDLNADGVGSIEVTRGTNCYAVIYADVLVPASSGGGFSLHGNVKKAIPKTFYATSGIGSLDSEPTWGTSSDSFLANSSDTLTIRALESTSEAGAFAIADQMVEFALGVGRLESTLQLPNLHVFWASGTGSTYPTAATTSTGTILHNPTTNRPMLMNEIWYGGPSNSADAFNDGLLLETFARGLFAYGSDWQPTYESIIRSDNDSYAYIEPYIASESTIAFTSGYATFLSSALRNDPNVHLMDSTGAVDTWRLDQHDISPVDGGEFYASSIARAQWGIWKSVLGGNTTGLQTLWAATTANQPYEYGNAPLGCYPTYLLGLKRMAGSLAYNAMLPQLNAENVGKGADVTLSSYLDGTTLWTTIAPGGGPIAGSLTTYNNNLDGYRDAYYDRVQARTYRVVLGSGSHTLNISTSSPGVIVELFDMIGYLDTVKATSGTPGTKTLTLPAGTYAVRVRVNPSLIYNGSPADYSLTIN